MKGLVTGLVKRYFPENKKKESTRLSEKYRKSGLTLEQAIIIKERIEFAFQEDKIYRQNDLGLVELSNYIDFDRYKVSEVINKYFSKNFYALLNHYRIQEAKELLISRPFSSVKAVMYEVGFNSKNSFYNAFKKDTGLSPNDFRSMWAYEDGVNSRLQFH
ncbi:helix-turn-helix domain-containing protein [Allomuricauda sp. d1]|uniref:helix-turn-helix domain-containing protein n=1 Tax=Allomuricauda sp. d1 TaxID=3136725 RepID=UPI0031DBF1A8